MMANAMHTAILLLFPQKVGILPQGERKIQYHVGTCSKSNCSHMAEVDATS